MEAENGICRIVWHVPSSRRVCLCCRKYDGARLARPAIMRIWRMGRGALDMFWGDPAYLGQVSCECVSGAHGPST